MNRFILFTGLLLFAVFILMRCQKGLQASHCPGFERDLPTGGTWNNPSDWKKAESGFVGIRGISFENYPRVDGSTSVNILNTMVACKLLGIGYRWMESNEWYLATNWDNIPVQYGSFFGTRVKTSQTHGAFMNLINGNADIILTSSSISPEEKAYADSVGVTLIESSIALDAFVFIVNKYNPVNSLTVDQIRKIYTKEITNWSEVGGYNVNMRVFTRTRNSGSEETFRDLVMSGLEPADFPLAVISSMSEVFREVSDNVASICYTFNTYKDMQARKLCNEVPVLAINGICPDENTVKNRTYPLTTEVLVSIRSDLDRNSMAYELYKWLHSNNAKHTITESGFVPK